MRKPMRWFFLVAVGLLACIRPPSTQAVSCVLPANGDAMLSNACTIDGTKVADGSYVSGLASGNIIVSGVDVTIQPDTTITWNHGRSIVIQNGGRIFMGANSHLHQADLHSFLREKIGFDVYAAGSPVRVLSQDLFVCTTDTCTITSPGGNGNVLVEGRIKIAGGSPGAGKVLTSDANGLGSWQTPAAGGGGWTDSGSLVQLTTGTDNVLIGSTSHDMAKLEAAGEIVSSALGSSGGNIRMISGNYGAFFRNDGSDTYLLLTNSADPFGTWNSLRPFTVNNASGRVGIGGAANGTYQLSVNGDIISGYLRTTGNTGWYNETWGGGWYMSDASWIRSSGNKSVYTGAGILANDAGLSIGAGGAHYNANGASFLGNVTIGKNAAANAQLDVAPGNAGDGLVISRTTDNNTNIQGYIDGHYADRTTYASGCCNILSLQPEVGGVMIGGTTGDLGAYKLYVNGITYSGDFECPGCIDQGDLKSSIGQMTGIGLNGSPFLNFVMQDFSFFPNMGTGDGNRYYFYKTNDTGAPTAVGRYSMPITSLVSFIVTYRYITASRDQEIFGWYDPKENIIRQLWISEIPLNATQELPVTASTKMPDGWIPVQATLYDDDLTTLGKQPDAERIIRNYTFTRVGKASELPPGDELVQRRRQEHDTCLAQEKEKLRRQRSNRNPESKCFQFITAPGIYYGKLEPSRQAAAKWTELDKQSLAVAARIAPDTRADLAEKYQGSENLEPGTIIAIDRKQNNFLIPAAGTESEQLAGVISTSPHDVMGDERYGNLNLALTGRVPVRMSRSSLPVLPGDIITVAREAGLGAKATQAGWVVGKALEAWQPESGKTTVMVLLNTFAYDPQLVHTSLEGFTLREDADGGFHITDLYEQAVNRVLAAKQALVGTLEAGSITARSLTVGGVNVGEKLQELEGRLNSKENVQAAPPRVGSALLPMQGTTVFVRDPRVTSSMKILLTARTVTDRPLAVTDIRDGSGFTVAVSRAGEAVAFDYWLVKP